jgi:hypothetical protein
MPRIWLDKPRDARVEVRISEEDKDEGYALAQYLKLSFASLVTTLLREKRHQLTEAGHRVPRKPRDELGRTPLPNESPMKRKPASERGKRKPQR